MCRPLPCARPSLTSTTQAAPSRLPAFSTCSFPLGLSMLGQLSVREGHWLSIFFLCEAISHAPKWRTMMYHIPEFELRYKVALEALYTSSRHSSPYQGTPRPIETDLAMHPLQIWAMAMTEKHCFIEEQLALRANSHRLTFFIVAAGICKLSMVRSDQVLPESRARAKFCFFLLRGRTISTIVFTDCSLDYEQELELIDLPRKRQHL